MSINWGTSERLRPNQPVGPASRPVDTLGYNFHIQEANSFGSLSQSELLKLARMGAEARISELRQELDAIHRAFPGLQRGGQAPRVRGADAQPRSRATGRKRKDWSAAQRQAAADRMRKYWAAKKAAKGKK